MKIKGKLRKRKVETLTSGSSTAKLVLIVFSKAFHTINFKNQCLKKPNSFNYFNISFLTKFLTND